MNKKIVVLVMMLTLGMIWSCGISETEQNAEIEDIILSLIAGDDSTYALEGLGNVEDENYSLSKESEPFASALAMTEVIIDSNYIWRFGRTDMNSVREITIEIENDTAAIALISHQITGVFHARQFVRVWTSDSTWERGDSVQFSEKAIDMTVDRRVAFRRRSLPNGNERWIASAMTVAYGHTGETLNIQSLEWVAGDSTRILTDFESVFYNRGTPLAFIISDANQINVIVSNDVTEEAEAVVGRFGFNPRLNGADLRNRIHFRYMESFDSGDKRYSRPIPPVHHPLRHFKGFIEVFDFRTLFDHNYDAYSSAVVGFVYTMRQNLRP